MSHKVVHVPLPSLLLRRIVLFMLTAQRMVGYYVLGQVKTTNYINK